MKLFTFVLMAFFIGIGTKANGGECCCKGPVEFRVVTPLDVLMGVGHYSHDVSKRVFKGTKTIIKAPFESEMLLPPVRQYKYYPGYFVPGRFERVVPSRSDINTKEMVPMLTPKPVLGDPSPNFAYSF